MAKEVKPTPTQLVALKEIALVEDKGRVIGVNFGLNDNILSTYSCRVDGQHQYQYGFVLIQTMRVLISQKWVDVISKRTHDDGRYRILYGLSEAGRVLVKAQDND